MKYKFNKKTAGYTIGNTVPKQCERLAVEVNFGMAGERVTRALDRLVELRGKPAGIQTDNRPEFAGNALDAWAYRQGVKPDFIQPGKLTLNAFIEIFNGRFREECLNDNRFVTIVEAQDVIEAWRMDYNDERPHGSLNGLTPSEFAGKLLIARIFPARI